MTTLKQLRQQLANQEVTAKSLVDQALKKATETQELNIFTEVLADSAQKQAIKIDNKRARGESLGKLAGIPFVVKDNFLVAGTTTTASAEILENFVAPYTATSVQKLLDQDAILIGKTNLDAFGHGTSTENSSFGPTNNPKDKTKVAGGSSGGSAAAVAAEIVPFALGTDTGGSVRLPASFCGVVGYKPTYGLISRYGVVAMASSTDCVAPITNYPEDAQDLMEIMMGRDPFDGTTIESLARPPKAKNKLGLIKQFNRNLAPAVEQAFKAAVAKLNQAGHEIVELSLPSLEHALACYYVLVPAEISSNLSRYQGLIYGKRVEGKDWQTTIAKTRSRGFMAENKRRIMIGTYVLSSGYYEAYYQKAQKLRTRLISEFSQAFKQVDSLICPVAPFTAFELGNRTQDPLKMYQADLMTVAASLAGLPAISVPLLSKGMPVGLQIMAPAGSDRSALKLASELNR